MKNKLKVAVLFGGQSSEHDVSCMSVKNVLRNLDPDKYEPVISPFYVSATVRLNMYILM